MVVGFEGVNMKVKVKGTNICKSCKYRGDWCGVNTGCNYLGVEKKSRLIEEDGSRGDPDYCTKYEKGRSVRENYWIKAKMGRYK